MRWWWLAVGAVAAATAAAPNLLPNPSLETPGVAGAPASWSGLDFGTGGRFELRSDGGQDGRAYGVLIAATPQQRACWRTKVPVPTGCQAVAFGGWYRTRQLAAGTAQGPALRVHFHRSTTAYDEIGLKVSAYLPAADWTRVEGAWLLPAGTVAVELQAFNFFAPGEVHWDNLWLRPARPEEVRAMPLAPEHQLDREPQPGRNLPHHPAAGDTVGLNPPPFRWLPSEPGCTYRLQVAADDRFAAPLQVDHQGLIWCAEMLTEPLPVGTWCWRYGVDRQGQPTVWSQPRRFTVPADAAPWPYPGRERLKVATAHPRLFITAARLPEFRRRAATGDLRETAANLLKSIQANLDEPLVPEPAFLTGTGQERSQQYAKTFRETRPPMDLMERAALAWLLTTDARAGAEAKRRVLHFFSWDPRGSTSVSHNDEPAMWIMMRGVRAYDWTWDLYTPAERERIDAAIRTRAEDFYKHLSRRPYENNPYESHAGRIIGFLGEAALALLPEVPEATTWLDYITRIYWGVWPAWGQDDGGWNEGPGYWSAYMTFGLHFVVALREATGIDLARRPFLHQTPYYRLYLTPPYSQMAPYGDGTQFAPHRSWDLMYWFSSLTQDPALRWYPAALGKGSGDSILGVVLKDDALQPQPPTTLPQARLFAGVGLAVLHTNLADGANNVMFALRSSPYGAVSHGHNDQNCFVLEAFGEPLAIATGHYPWYGSPHHDQWTRATKAKCGITHDGGQGQDRGWAAKGRITAFQHGPDFDLVCGDATAAYGGRLTRAIREVVHVRPGVLVIRDDLAAAEPRRFEYQLHALDEMAVDEAAATVTTTRPQASLVTRFLAPAGLAFSQTDRYTPEPEGSLGGKFTNTWHLTAAAEPARETEFLTVLLPAKAGEAATRPVVQALTGVGARGVALHWPDGRRTVVGFRLPGATGPATLDDVTSDGRVFAVTTGAGEGPVGQLAGGQELTCGGQAVRQTAATR